MTTGPQLDSRDRLGLATPVGFAPLRTERLELRPLRPSDAEGLHRLINHWDVARNLAHVPFPYPRDFADEWIAKTLLQLRDASGYHLGITAAGGGSLIGVVGLQPVSGERCATLGYWLGSRVWGQGFATEAARRLAHWGLANLDLDFLRATVADDNPASMAVLRRIGFVETGTARQNYLARGGDQPARVFEATREGLFKTHRPPETPVATARRMVLVAACALVDLEGRVLIARRPEGKRMAGLWEFPGGKMDEGETPEAALIRELREELGIGVERSCLAPLAFASHAYDDFHLLMPLYICRRWTGVPTGREGQALAWVRAGKLADYPMPDADKPLIPMLRDFL